MASRSAAFPELTEIAGVPGNNRSRSTATSSACGPMAARTSLAPPPTHRFHGPTAPDDAYVLHLDGREAALRCGHAHCLANVTA
jgi:hypothetical protein